MNKPSSHMRAKAGVIGKESTLAGMMFQLMEDVWLTHDLDKKYNADLYSGWHSLFIDRMNTEQIAEKWSIFKVHFSKGIINYIEQHYAGTITINTRQPPSI